MVFTGISARNLSDYSVQNTLITIPPGQESRTINALQILPDDRIEETKTVRVDWNSVAVTNAVPIDPHHVISIIDDDFATVGFDWFSSFRGMRDNVKSRKEGAGGESTPSQLSVRVSQPAYDRQCQC